MMLFHQLFYKGTKYKNNFIFLHHDTYKIKFLD